MRLFYPTRRGCRPFWGPLHGREDTAALPTSSGAVLSPPYNTGPCCPLRDRVAYLGMGWAVGTTGTNLGQLAICSWTFTQEETCTLILASVTWGRGRAGVRQGGPCS